MNQIIKQISQRINDAQDKIGYLDVLFGANKQEVLNGTDVVLFGAGNLGKEINETLKSNGVCPACFCDNDNSKSGSYYCDLSIISFDELQKFYHDSLIIIATHKYLESVTKQLLGNGFKAERILCKNSEPATYLLYMYSMMGTQILLKGYRDRYSPHSTLDVLHQNEQAVADAYHLFADRKSKDLYLAKLALMASNGNFELFKDFILEFSEPILEFGIFNFDGTTEDYYYFNNDVLSILPNEVYVDVGAFDGDTVQTFVTACDKLKIDYKHIYAFEPDPNNYQSLVKNSKMHKNVSCHQLGLWSTSTQVPFRSSEDFSIDSSSAIDKCGNIKIQVVALDDFLRGEEVTYIKMDPGGNIIPEALKGATGTIEKFKPKLALGAYHSLEAIFEIPLIVKKICPDYKLYLRHNTYHLCDTDLYATP
jgi:FkbM family methyltransferase